MKTILVTGGAGFIGSHISALLLEEGYKVIIFDSFINSSPKVIEKILTLLLKKKDFNKKNLKLVKGDLRDFQALNNLFYKQISDKESIEGVIHLAGLKSTFKSIQDPLKYWDSNLIGTINLIKVMQNISCNKLIFSSSASIYNLTENLPLSEDSLLNPINPYGNTKLANERLLKDLYNSNSIFWKIASLRYFNPLGAHPSGLLGEDSNDLPNNIFPLIIKVAQKEIKNFHIYGNDWPTKDGTAIRDYIHVMDVAKAHILALNYLENNGPQYIEMNIGTGKATSVLELINIFQDVNKVEIPYVFSKRRKGDNGIVYADISLATKLLNWKPTKSLEDMCRDGWNWKLKNPNGYKI
jgi:UDP-glucose 4-epimerase